MPVPISTILCTNSLLASDLPLVIMRRVFGIDSVAGSMTSQTCSESNLAEQANKVLYFVGVLPVPLAELRLLLGGSARLGGLLLQRCWHRKRIRPSSRLPVVLRGEVLEPHVEAAKLGQQVRHTSGVPLDALQNMFLRFVQFLRRHALEVLDLRSSAGHQVRAGSAWLWRTRWRFASASVCGRVWSACDGLWESG